MPLLGEGVQFNIGTSSTTGTVENAASGVDMSLDDMIKSRRKEQVSRSRRGASARKASAADRVIGAGKAKRAAAINARRGIQKSSKPTAMEIEKEVYRQSRSTARQKENRNTKKAGLPKAANSNKRRSNRNKNNTPIGGGKPGPTNTGRQLQSTPPAWVAGTRRPPSKKAVSAAVNAMSDAGFNVPQGMQMVITFAPAPDAAPTNTKQGKTQNSAKKNTKSNRGRGRNKK